MKARFKMNRIGFVNFWLYDEEEFEFVDGKLLLRGQNASGKSITTQSFIPFILDGDRTPNRLDPFGSSDRRMEYYFLGEEGKEESTGYLFLEFKKEDSEEYRTIAIGQRAKRGKPMDFWGFILLDRRRIGHDLQLYKEIGTSRIPFDRREMKAELGEDNFFTTSQSEYKNAVNQYIFGFRKAEQYEQFIKLLVKVRAPKLSKEFKPTRVYEILNDSLQTLTDEELRAMVDAMEKMDEIQESLELLKRAFDDVKIIRNEYIRYNQYMLAKKAQAYMAVRQKVEEERQKLDIEERKRRETEEEQNDKNRRLLEVEKRKNLKETEWAGLLDTDLEEIDRKLELARKEKAEASAKASGWEKRIQEYQKRIWEGERSLEEIRSCLELIRQEMAEAREALGEQQEILQWNRHEEALRIIGGGAYEESGELVKELELQKKLLMEGKKEICEYEEIVRQYDELAARLERLQREKQEEEQKLQEAQEAVALRAEQWITALYAVKKEAVCWKPDQGLLSGLEEKMREYRSAEDAEPVRELMRIDYERQRRTLTDRKHSLEYQEKIQKEELRQKKEALVGLQNAEELEPDRDERAEETRKALWKAGIRAVPFYKTVEFSAELNEKDCAGLEAQLQKMGILDALVVSPDDFEKIRERCPGFLDTILYVKEYGNSDFSRLTPSEELEPALKETVQKILSNIYEQEGDGQEIFLGKDGSFRQGILAGKAEKNGSAEFVGALARKRRKEQKIRDLVEEIAECAEAAALLEKEIAAAQEHLEKLEEEYQRWRSIPLWNRRKSGNTVCRGYLKNAGKKSRRRGSWY